MENQSRCACEQENCEENKEKARRRDIVYFVIVFALMIGGILYLTEKSPNIEKSKNPPIMIKEEVIGKDKSI